MSEKIKACFIFLLVFIVSAAVFMGLLSPPTIAQNTSGQSSLPLSPPVIGDVYMNFFGGYPEARNNSTIMEFIDTYGLIGYYNEKACLGSYDYRFVYLLPGGECSEKLVFLDHTVYEGKKNETILWVRLVDKDVELPPLNESECLSLGIKYRKDTDANSAAGFAMGTAIISVAILALLARRKK